MASVERPTCQRDCDSDFTPAPGEKKKKNDTIHKKVANEEVPTPENERPEQHTDRYLPFWENMFQI